MRFFITTRLYWFIIGLILLLIFGYFLPLLYAIAQPLIGVLVLLVAVDILLLFGSKDNIDIGRKLKERFSNGDENQVTLEVTNQYAFFVNVKVLDEIPFQFQIRDFEVLFNLKAGEAATHQYHLRPTTRGVYSFGKLNMLVLTRLGLVGRIIRQQATFDVKVYPSFIKLHQYELMAISRQLHMHGQKRVRKIGNSQEFDTIRDYVRGDDPRHINWSATARRGHLMMNHFVDERAQNVYCIIDKSRVMKMPFEGLTLLDYAINASLVLADVSLRKGDKSGLITFEDKIDDFVKAGSRNLQLHQLMEALYRQQTSFKEPDVASVYHFLRANINQRSLLLFFTNYESIHSLNRQLKYLQLINRDHLLLVIYFKNTEVDVLLKQKANNVREIYDQTIGYQIHGEKIQIKEALRQAGILSLYTSPQNLNVDIINKYIEVKTKRIL